METHLRNVFLLDHRLLDNNLVTGLTGVQLGWGLLGHQLRLLLGGNGCRRNRCGRVRNVVQFHHRLALSEGVRFRVLSTRTSVLGVRASTDGGARSRSMAGCGSRV